MYNYLLNTDIVKVYNGTNHDVSLYKIDNENFKSSRSCSKQVFYLNNPTILPVLKFNQKTAQNITPIPSYSISYEKAIYSLPAIINVIPLPDFDKYDVIIVSRLYAEAILKSGYPFGPNYIDRLYVSKSDVKNNENQIIGCSGLEKVSWPLNIDYYLNSFQNQCTPSLISARLCLKQWKATPNANLIKIAQLENYIIQEEAKRKNECPSYFNV